MDKWITSTFDDTPVCPLCLRVDCTCWDGIAGDDLFDDDVIWTVDRVELMDWLEAEFGSMTDRENNGEENDGTAR